MEYTFKTKQMIKIAEQVGNFYDLEKAVYENDMSKLATLISILGDVGEEQALDEIDKQVDEGKKIADIYKEIFDGINKKGFFKAKLQVNLEAPPIDTEKMIQLMYETQMQKELANLKTTPNM